jgi:hypothetical protein
VQHLSNHKAKAFLHKVVNELERRESAVIGKTTTHHYASACETGLPESGNSAKSEGIYFGGLPFSISRTISYDRSSSFGMTNIFRTPLPNTSAL